MTNKKIKDWMDNLEKDFGINIDNKNDFPEDDFDRSKLYTMSKERRRELHEEIDNLRQIDKETSDRVRATWTENKK